MHFTITHPMHSHPYNPELVTGEGIAKVAAPAVMARSVYAQNSTSCTDAKRKTAAFPEQLGRTPPRREGRRPRR